jgi:diaphanous 1
MVLDRQDFIRNARGEVDSLKQAGTALSNELKAVLSYFGESVHDPSSSEAGLKPEDFFALIVTFSSSLQVSPAYDRLVKLLKWLVHQ